MSDENIQGKQTRANMVSPRLVRSISTSNAVVKIGIVLSSTWLIVALLLGAFWLTIAALIALICDTLGLFLHSRQYHNAARVIWLQGSNVAIFLGSLVIHPDGMLSMMLYAMTVVTFIIFSWDYEKSLLILNSAIPISLWFVSQFVGSGLLGIQEFGQEIATSLAYLSGGTTFLLSVSVAVYFSHFTMITEQALIEARNDAQKADKAKSEFLACMSHELRTPLTSLIGSLGLVTGNTTGELPDKAQALLSVGQRNAERLLLLINDILDISKIEAGKLEYHMQAIDILNLARQALVGVEHYGKMLNVSFELTHFDEDLAAIGDERRLMQVISNLLSNAAKFSNKEGVVKIKLERLNQDILIKVIDSGIGIPDDFKSRIFGKFTQADSSNTRKTGGTGLGLHISKAIVEAHCGRLDFESKQGHGTTFTITLPAACTGIISEQQSKIA